jgi:multidrug efflux pump
MMCAYLLKHDRHAKHHRIYLAVERFFDWILSSYRITLEWVLEHSALMLGVLFITMALNVYIIVKIPKGFFPQQDTGALAGGMQGPQDSSFFAMDDSLRRLQTVIAKDPAVQSVIGFTGGQGATNTGTMAVTLKPLEQRGIGVAAVINRLRPKLNNHPVASAFLQAVQDLQIGGRSSNALYQYTIRADNSTDLRIWGPKLLAGMKQLKGFQDVNSDAGWICD